MAGAAVEVDVKPNMAQFTSGLQSGLSKAASGAGKVAQAAFGVITTAAKTALGGAAVFAGTALVTGFKRITAIENATASLTTIMGSAAKAGDFMGEILKTVQGTPFNLDQFATAGKNLVAFGLDAQKVPGYLTAIGNAAAASGKGAEAVDQIVDALGKAAAAGKITGDTINSLSAQGVQALQILANHFGVSTEEMQKMISSGAVPAEEAIDALADGIMNGTNGMAGSTVALGGAMEALRGTFEGAWGGMKAATARFGAAFIGPFLGQMTGGLTSFAGVLDSLAPTVEAFATKTAAQLTVFGKKAKAAFEEFSQGFSGGGDVTGFFGQLGAGASDLVAKLAPLGPAFTDAIGQKASSAGKIITSIVLPALGTLASIAGELIGPITRVGSVLSEVFGTAIDVAAGALKSFTSNSGGFISGAKAIGDAIATVAENLAPLVQAGFVALGSSVNVAISALSGLLGVLKPLTPVLTAVGTAAAVFFAAFKGVELLKSAGAAIASFGSNVGGKVAGALQDAGAKAMAMTEQITGSTGAADAVGSAFASGAEKATGFGSVMGKVGAALPVVGAAVSGVGLLISLMGSQAREAAAEVEAANKKISDSTTAVSKSMAVGGQERVNAEKQLTESLATEEAAREKAITAAQARLDQVNRNSSSSTGAVAKAEQQLYEAQKKRLFGQEALAAIAAAAAESQKNSLSKVDAATQDVTVAQNDLALAVGKYGEAHPKTIAASDALAAAQDKLAASQKEVANASKDATQAMAEQAAQALAAVNATLGYQQAQLTAKQAVQEANAVLSDGSASADARAQAEINLQTAFVNVAAAADTKAQSDFAGQSAAVISAESARMQNAAMMELAASSGVALPAGMAATVAANNRTIASAQMTTAAFNLVSSSIVSVPDGKTVIISDNSPSTIQKLQALGYTVKELPDGTIEVTAETGQAITAADAAVTNINAKSATIKVFADAVGIGGTISTNAKGNIIEPYATGGLRKMTAGVATMVQPNTWRVVGDRPRDPEAYIPINRASARSKMLLEETARRMGARIAWYATGGITAAPIASTAPRAGSTTQITNNLYEVGDAVATATATVRRQAMLGAV